MITDKKDRIQLWDIGKEKEWNQCIESLPCGVVGLYGSLKHVMELKLYDKSCLRLIPWFRPLSRVDVMKLMSIGMYPIDTNVQGTVEMVDNLPMNGLQSCLHDWVHLFVKVGNNFCFRWNQDLKPFWTQHAKELSFYSSRVWQVFESACRAYLHRYEKDKKRMKYFFVFWHEHHFSHLSKFWLMNDGKCEWFKKNDALTKESQDDIHLFLQELLVFVMKEKECFVRLQSVMGTTLNQMEGLIPICDTIESLKENVGTFLPTKSQRCWIIVKKNNWATTSSCTIPCSILDDICYSFGFVGKIQCLTFVLWKHNRVRGSLIFYFHIFGKRNISDVNVNAFPFFIFLDHQRFT